MLNRVLRHGFAVWLLFALGLGQLFGNAQAQALQTIPALTAHVIDTTQTLDADAKRALEDKLAVFERDKGSQIVVLMVATTLPEDLASYANRVGNAWKIGRKGVGDGLLLVVAKDDHKVRIEVAKTLEGAIPDLAARHIIDNAITPNFRAGNYGAGLQAAVGQVMGLISGEALPVPTVAAPEPQGLGAGGFQWTDLAIFLFVAVPVAGRMAAQFFGRKPGSVILGAGVGALAFFVTASALIAGVAAVLSMVVTLLLGAGSGLVQRGGSGFNGRGGLGNGGNGWSTGSSGSSGSSSGGFSSGGGGDFGGGGASGDW